MVYIDVLVQMAVDFVLPNQEILCALKTIRLILRVCSYSNK